MYPDLKGKIALVTGAGRRAGIGWAVARRLAADGADVVLADTIAAPGAAGLDPPAGGRREELAALAAELAGQFGVRARFVAVDVADSASVGRLAAEVQAAFGRLDLLCNNAGTVRGVPNAVHTYPEADWVATVDVNLHGVFRVSKALVPLMLGRPAAIVNIASRAAKVPPLFNGAYAVSKAGVVMLTKVMAKELAGAGIRVNAVCPGVITTDFTRWRFALESRVLGASEAERAAEMVKSIPLGRLGSAEEVANLVAFLFSEASAYMTGQAVNVTGGQLMEL
jgi:NAD(P)-dependent dehydrogenase (short-subunit alcohol dehydrogenase family)